MTNCNEINIEAGRLKAIFGKCYNLKAIDLRDVVDLIESVKACGSGDFALKTINGVSLFGTGDLVITADVDGTETKIQQGQGIVITGTGSATNPYIVTSGITQADGSETKLNPGANVTIAGQGTTANPYVINANVPIATEQVNADWSSISGKSTILNKPNIPAAQVKADWNAISGPSEILNKPNNVSTNLGTVAGEFGVDITSSTGSSASIPLVTETNAGLVNNAMLEGLRANLDNVKLNIIIAMPASETKAGFTEAINAMAFVDILAHQIPTFKAIRVSSEEATMFSIEIIGRGRSGYGVGGFQITSDQIRVTSAPLSGTDLEEFITTQVIDLGTSTYSAAGTLNTLVTDVIIQSQIVGYILIRGIFAGKYKEFLWIGTAGAYGSTGLQCARTDLHELGRTDHVHEALPSFTEVAAVASLPTSGIEGVMYITSDENEQYRWKNGAYVLTSAKDKNYVHTQGVPSTLWTIAHNMNKKPSVTIMDGVGNEYEGVVVYTDLNNLTIEFSVSFNGIATLN
jgi:hypothetical protein